MVAAIRKAADLQGQINSLDGRIAELDRERSAITQDQDRIRRNMSSVQQGTDLHTRYVKKLNEQEDRIETLIGERETLLTDRTAAQIELDAYLRDLNVG